MRLPKSPGLAAYAYREREPLSAILEILHAAQQEQDEGDSGSLDGRLVEGLLVAGRLIVEFAE